MAPEEEEAPCEKCEGYTYEGGFSFNESMNIRIKCDCPNSYKYDELSDELKR